MPKFSIQSMEKLQTCDQRLQLLALAVVQHFDATVVCGRRLEKAQNKFYYEGNSRLLYPKSKHNKTPSKAIDLAPYISGKGIVWETKQCYYFAGYVMKTAESLGIKIRWGGDWDRDSDVNDQTFNDLVHFELID